MRSITICLFGFKVYEYFDDTGENMIEALTRLVDAPESDEPVLDDGSFTLPMRNHDYADVDPDMGRTLLDRSPEDPT